MLNEEAEPSFIRALFNGSKKPSTSMYVRVRPPDEREHRLLSVRNASRLKEQRQGTDETQRDTLNLFGPALMRVLPKATQV